MSGEEKSDGNEANCRRIDEDDDDDVEFVEARQPPMTRSRAANGRGDCREEARGWLAEGRAE